MGDPGHGLLRVVRGGVVASCCTSLALLGHVLAGGHMPSLAALIVCAALIGSAFSILADRRRSFHHLLAAALGAQVVFHTAFALAEPPRMVGHDPGTPTGLGLPFAGVDALMVGGHVVAAAAVAALAAHGDRLLWAAFDLVAGIRLPSLDVVATPRLPRWVPVLGPTPALAAQVLARAHPRRGPPLLAG